MTGQQEFSVSAVIPAYNAAEFLPATIRSIRDQSHPVHEIIVVDDGSTDGTTGTTLGADIRFIRQENAGPSAARNRGIQEATGDWIAFLDADDQWPAEKTARQLECLRRDPSLALIAGDMEETGENGELITPSALAKHDFLGTLGPCSGRAIPDALTTLLGKNFIPTGSVIARRDILLELGGFDTAIRYGEDLELWARIAARHNIACLTEICLTRHKHGGNVTGHTGPLLADLVRVKRKIRSWGKQQLQNCGFDADHMVADAVFDYAYWFFTEGRLPQARQWFRAGLAEEYSHRMLLYYLACLLPASMVGGLRSMKQQLGRK